MQTILIYLIASVVMFLNGCTIHIPDVQQGNVLEPEMLAQLHPGLSKKQVKFLLGTPMVNDPFHPDRWDYVYLLETQGKQTVRKQVTVFFDNDALSRIDTDGVTLPEAASPN
jgi:outer membrane protein assembly factor BamE